MDASASAASVSPQLADRPLTQEPPNVVDPRMFGIRTRKPAAHSAISSSVPPGPQAPVGPPWMWRIVGRRFRPAPRGEASQAWISPAGPGRLSSESYLDLVDRLYLEIDTLET